jgi:7,8-dihydropterin-6-yl-methyl-4-(beta-D-ribofuranosyl)aminobenzene 5'-phosphate synthase
MRKLLLLTCSILLLTNTRGQQVTKLRITILSTMLADLKGTGEWGFSALVETDSTRILLDVGGRPTTVRDNAAELKVDLSGIQQLVLSHNHFDHTAGLPALRQKFADGKTLSTTFIGQGFFLRDTIPVGMNLADSLAYTASGGKFQVVGQFTRIGPGVWLTGPVPRKYPEKNYPHNRVIHVATGTKEDNVAEDMSMVIETPKGLVLLTGCGHAGIVNTIDYTLKQFPGQKIVAVIGGMHLLDSPDEQVAWTAGKLKDAGVQYFVGAHCTGINATYQIRQLTGLSKTNCLVGSVGMSFDLEHGVTTGWLR